MAVIGLGGGVGEIAQQRELVDGAERPRQVALDEALHAAQRLERGLHEDARRLLDVLAGLQQQPWRLPQLRQHAASALLRRRVGEQRLRREAHGERLRVELRAALPRSHLLELVLLRPDVRLQHGSLEPLDLAERLRAHGVEPPAEGPEVPQQRVDGRPRAVLEQIVVRVHAVASGGCREDLVQEAEVVVDEMR